MKNATKLLSLGLIIAAALALTAQAQIGKPFPKLTFEGFSQTEATTIEDFEGRLMLVEVFAHW